VKPGTEIWFKTDNKDLFEASLQYFNDSAFEVLYYTYDLHQSGFEPNVVTEYERKFADLGMKIMFTEAKLKK
jgi:tRNA (guanine-N7-)-methyltransferase